MHIEEHTSAGKVSGAREKDRRAGGELIRVEGEVDGGGRGPERNKLDSCNTGPAGLSRSTCMYRVGALSGWTLPAPEVVSLCPKERD